MIHLNLIVTDKREKGGGVKEWERQGETGRDRERHGERGREKERVEEKVIASLKICEFKKNNFNTVTLLHKNLALQV